MPDMIFDDELAQYMGAIDADYNALTFRAAMEQAEAHAAGGMAEHILNSRAPDGTAYRPLAPATLARRGNKGMNRTQGIVRPLIDTGRLIQSLHSGPGHVEDIEDQYMTTGTNVEYAALQNFGAGRIPAREFAGWTDEAEEKTADLVADHIVRSLTH